jgi:hypothetical protein
MLVGAGAVDIAPRLPIDLGYVRLAIAARAAWGPLQARACLFRTDEAAIVVLSADLVGITRAFASRVRQAVANAVACRVEDVLVTCSHRPAALWRDPAIKLGGGTDGSQLELSHRESLPRTRLGGDPDGSGGRWRHGSPARSATCPASL